MTDTVAALAALGVAGFDPLGALALIAAMALGAGRRAIVVLLVSTLGSTLVLALVLSSTVGRWAIGLLHRLHSPGHLVWGGLVTLAGLALLTWAVRRLRRPVTPGDRSARHAASSPGPLGVVGLGVGLSALVDPAFYGLVVLAGGLSGGWERFGACLLWVVMSQIALISLGIAVFAGAFDTALRLIERARARWLPSLRVLASLTLVVVGALAVVEGIGELAGEWILP